MSKIPVIIDVDTGIDDAMALVLACASEKLNIVGATTVGGNVDLIHTTRNTLNVLDYLGRSDIPVAEGAAKPLYRELFKASGVHGSNGLRGWDFEENAVSALVPESAWEFMAKTLKNSDEKITIIALGPCTNIAKLILEYPEVIDKIEKIVFMGASHNMGNPLVYSTFNVMVDPEAFEICMNAVPFYACTLNATTSAYLSEEDKNEIRNLKGLAADFVNSIFGGYSNGTDVKKVEEIDPLEEKPKTEAQLEKYRGKYSIHDAVTIAFVSNPELFTYKKYYCEVESKGEKTYGMTIIDVNDYFAKAEDEKNLYYISKINKREDFRDMFIKAIKEY